MLQEVPEILVGQQPEQASAPARGPGDLEVDERGGAVGPHQDIRLLGEIVVHDVAPVQKPQESQRVAMEGGTDRLRLIQRPARQVAARQRVPVRCEQRRDAVDAG